MDPCSAARCVAACPVPRVASRFGVNVAGSAYKIGDINEGVGAKRRAQRSGSTTRPLALSPKPDPVSGQEAKNGWKILLGLAIGFAGALVGALSGVRLDNAR